MKKDEGAKAVRVWAPAKVNLILRILDRLPTGYHRIWSVMQTVDLADRLTLRYIPAATDIAVHCGHPSVPKDRGNLVYQAADLVLKQAGLSGGLEIELEKHIPMAAGLGGGSSDAAATVFGLARLLELGWSSSNLAELGARLGSDVAFFFSAPSALIREWGQEVLPLSITGERWIVLVNPGFPIETKWAYERLASTREKVRPIHDELKKVDHGRTIAWDDLTGLMENDFEPALFPVFPELSQLKTELLAAGAQAALLSGSGATMFGVFPDERTALEAKRALNRDSRRQVFAVKSHSTSFGIEETHSCTLLHGH